MQHIWTKQRQILVIITSVVLVYGLSLSNDFILGDDYDQILLNPLVHSLAHVDKIISGSTYYLPANQAGYGLFYRPLMLFSYALIYTLFGPNPAIFHLVSLVGHLINAILFMLILEALLPNLKKYFSLGLTLVFSLHPLNSEVVLHVASLQEVLFLNFGLLMLWLWTKKGIVPVTILAAGICLFLALLAKETAIIFAGLALCYAWLYQRSQIKQVALGSAIPVAGYLLMRTLLADVGYPITQASQIMQLPLGERLPQIPIVVSYYLTNFLIPIRLSIYQMWIYQGDWLELMGIVALGAIIGIGLVKGYRNLLQKSTKLAKPYLFFSIWTISGLVIHSQIWPLYLTVADRWFYATMAGLLGLIAVGVCYMQTQATKTLIWGLVVGIVLCGLLSWHRSQDWHDSQTLFTADLPKQTQNYFVANLLASVYINQKNYDAAEALLLDSVSQYPFGGNLSNLAIVLAHQGKFDQAYESFELALARQPTYSTIVNYANVALYLDQNYAKAQEVASNYLEDYPYSGDLYLTLAQAYYHQDKPDLALQMAILASQYHNSPLATHVLDQIRNNDELEIQNYLQY